MRRTAIAGFGTLPWQARNADHTFRSLALQAVKEALRNTGLSRADIDCVVYSIYSEAMLRQQIPVLLLQDYLGFQGLPCLRLEAGAASDGYALGAACSQIGAGLSDITLFVAIQKESDFYDYETGSREIGFEKGISNVADTVWLQPVMPGYPSFLTTYCVAPHIERHGNPTREQLAAVAAKNYRNAVRNAEARTTIALSVDEILDTPVVAHPTTEAMCAQHGDNACAMILAAEDVARQLTDRPVWISGMATSSYPMHRATAETVGRMRGTQIAAERAYRMAGVADPGDAFDLAQVHDLTSGIEMLAYEELGLCAPGESGRLVDEGIVEPDGPLPVNVDGGRIGCGHADAVSGAYAACEIVRQLREEAGGRQVAIRRGRGLLHCVDGYASSSSVTVLEL